MMIRTFKALSALLTYPTADLQQAVPEIREALVREGLLTRSHTRQLDRLLDEIAENDLYDLQERYVLLFDRTRSLSLHLFEHVHGESRDRGQAMVDLMATYESGGFDANAAELPDFLPLFLEFLSLQPPAKAYELLGQPAHILSAIAERLRKRRSAYEAVFRALVKLAATKPQREEIAALLAEPDPDGADLAALDAAWEDRPVRFGPETTTCKDDLIAKIRAGRRPAPGMTAAVPKARPFISSP